MSDTETFHLTTKDYTILEVMLERAIGRDETMRAILQRKISKATVMFREDIAPNVATMSSRVTYRVGDGTAEFAPIHDKAAELVRGRVLDLGSRHAMNLRMAPPVMVYAVPEQGWLLLIGAGDGCSHA